MSNVSARPENEQSESQELPQEAQEAREDTGFVTVVIPTDGKHAELWDRHEAFDELLEAAADLRRLQGDQIYEADAMEAVAEIARCIGILQAPLTSPEGSDLQRVWAERAKDHPAYAVFFVFPDREIQLAHPAVSRERAQSTVETVNRRSAENGFTAVAHKVDLVNGGVFPDPVDFGTEPVMDRWGIEQDEEHRRMMPVQLAWREAVREEPAFCVVGTKGDNKRILSHLVTEFEAGAFAASYNSALHVTDEVATVHAIEFGSVAIREKPTAAKVDDWSAELHRNFVAAAEKDPVYCIVVTGPDGKPEVSIPAMRTNEARGFMSAAGAAHHIWTAHRVDLSRAIVEAKPCCIPKREDKAAPASKVKPKRRKTVAK